MMSSQVVVRPKPGQAEAFVAAFNALAREVLANEPGALEYYLLRSRADPDSYRVVELYRDQAAYEVHKLAPHYVAGIRGILSLLDSTPHVEHFDAV